MKKPRKISVLITSSGGFGVPSYIDCLKNNYENRKIRIVCSDVRDVPLMHHKSSKFYLLPKGNSRNYIKKLVELCKKEKIDVVIPCSDLEVLVISKNISILEKRRIKCPIQKYDLTKNFISKTQVYDKLSKNSISVPKYFQVTNFKEFKKAIKNLGFPKKTICFKPTNLAISGGSKGFRILRRENSLRKIILDNKPGSLEIDLLSSLRFFQENKTKFIVMEYLPGEEYSVYVLAEKGKMLACIPILRTRVEQGFAFEAKIERHEQIENICKKIVKLFDSHYLLNVQFKLSNNIPKVIEINTRIAGAVYLPVAAGINFPYLALKQALNEKFSTKLNYKSTSMIRYWKELFLKNSKAFELSS